MTAEQIEARLEKARLELEFATSQADAANARSEAATPGGLSGYDPAILSGIRRKANRKADDRRWNAYTRAAEAQTALDRLRTKVRHLELELAAAERKEARVAFTAAELACATYVRDEHGWHKVVRVNAKTVSVETGYSWTDRIPLEHVVTFQSFAAVSS